MGIVQWPADNREYRRTSGFDVHVSADRVDSALRVRVSFLAGFDGVFGTMTVPPDSEASWSGMPTTVNIDEPQAFFSVSETGNSRTDCCSSFFSLGSGLVGRCIQSTLGRSAAMREIRAG